MSNCGLIEFAITDGTVTIDLLAANRGYSGFGVQGYIPGRPQLKDGGVWQDSNTESGRQLVFGVDTNIVDVVTLVCGGGSQSQVIKAFEEFDLMLQKARAYWTTNWQQQPVYLRARAKGETATRYAIIHYAKYDEYFNPYGQLFAGNGFKVCTEEFAFGIEHGLWLDLPPGQSESVPITHEGNSGDPIDVTGTFQSTTGMGLIVSNMSQASPFGGLQSVLRDDGGNFSINLLDGSPPYNLFNSPTASGDAAYFGGLFPFFALIFDLSAIISATAVWEFWNGSAWTSFTVNGEVVGGSIQTGITFAEWAPSAVATWVKTTVGGDTTQRYWVRVRLTSGGGSAVTQQNRHVYAATNNYVEIDDNEIVGTQSALARIEMFMWRAANGVSGNSPIAFLGLRGVDRGEQFYAQLNVGGGNPQGVTSPTSVVATTADTTAPGGAHAAVSNVSDFTGRAGIWVFSTAIANQYYGQFRLFVRLTTDDDTGASQMRYTFGVGDILSGTHFIVRTGETKSIPAPSSGQTLNNVLLDLGYISMPSSSTALYADELGGFTIILQANVPSGKTIKVYGITLLPVDEWAGEIIGETTKIDDNNFDIVLDPISNPKALRSYNVTINDLQPIVSARPFLHAGATQRLWFLFNFDNSLKNSGNTNSAPDRFASVRIAKVQRNMSLRSWPL